MSLKNWAIHKNLVIFIFVYDDLGVGISGAP